MRISSRVSLQGNFETAKPRLIRLCLKSDAAILAAARIDSEGKMPSRHAGSEAGVTGKDEFSNKAWVCGFRGPGGRKLR